MSKVKVFKVKILKIQISRAV